MEQLFSRPKKAEIPSGSILCRVNGDFRRLGRSRVRPVGGRYGESNVVLPATKGFEVGSGFQGTFLKGSEHNDAVEEMQMAK